MIVAASPASLAIVSALYAASGTACAPGVPWMIGAGAFAVLVFDGRAMLWGRPGALMTAIVSIVATYGLFRLGWIAVVIVVVIAAIRTFFSRRAR